MTGDTQRRGAGQDLTQGKALDAELTEFEGWQVPDP